MLQPIVASLQIQDIRDSIPARSLNFLRDLNQIVGVDSENSKQGNCTAELTDEWHFQRYDNNSSIRLKRHYNKWKVWIDGSFLAVGLTDEEVKKMILEFIGTKVLMYYASQNQCDYKRFMDWFDYSKRALTLQWFNLGYEATFKLFGPGGVITTTLKLLTLYNYLYEREGITANKPENFIDPLSTNPKVKNDVIQLLNIAQALSLSIRNRDFS